MSLVFGPPVGADTDDSVPFHRHRLLHGEIAIHGHDFAVVEDEVGIGAEKRSGKKNECKKECTPHHDSDSIGFPNQRECNTVAGVIRLSHDILKIHAE
jgi:hypothetical protein